MSIPVVIKDNVCYFGIEIAYLFHNKYICDNKYRCDNKYMPLNIMKKIDGNGSILLIEVATNTNISYINLHLKF